ncbi:hypothetical protein ACOSQ4_027720 [Xanthoceras sorbifolium]
MAICVSVVGFTSAKFLGTKVQFPILNYFQYTLEALIEDIYTHCCSTILDPTEKFKTEVRLPWSGQYVTLKNDMDLKDIFELFVARKLFTIRVDVELLPIDSPPSINESTTDARDKYSLASINGNQSFHVYDISSDEDDSCAAKDPPPMAESSEKTSNIFLIPKVTSARKTRI